MKRKIYSLLVALLACTTTLLAFNHEVANVHSPAMNKEVAVTILTPDGYSPTAEVIYYIPGRLRTASSPSSTII